MLKAPEKMTTPMRLYKRIKKDTAAKAPEFEYVEAEKDPLIYANFKSYGGTENVHNGRYIIIETATVTTWYRPDVQKGDKLTLEDGSEWEIKSLENVEMRNRLMILKVQRAGGA